MAKKKKPATSTPGAKSDWDEKAAEEETEEWDDESQAQEHAETLVEKAKNLGHKIADAFHVEHAKAESPKPEAEKAKKSPNSGATLSLSKVPGKMRKFLND